MESKGSIENPYVEKIGSTCDCKSVAFNGVEVSIEEMYKANTEKFATIYPDNAVSDAVVMSSTPERKEVSYSGAKIEKPVAYLPVFPGTNCDYDTAKSFERAGATVITSVFANLTSEMVFESIDRMVEMIDECNIFVLSGGFSSGDEPDGSGKFIATVLNNEKVTAAIHRLIDREGLILGICNGFQALVKSGLLPYGRLGMLTEESPTLFRNNINRHISQIVTTRVSTVNSPWLASFELGDQHAIAVSHGEGKFVVSEQMAEQLFANGQVAFQYVDGDGAIATQTPYNPNGSSYAIEGIISEDGRILGKMGHTERYEENLFKNISGNKSQEIFSNAVNYFKGVQKFPEIKYKIME